MALVFALLAACAAAPAEAKLYRDAVGRAVELKAEPRRIVSLAPNLTEILFALGLGARVVGVTTYCDWPPEARAKTKVGGFINPSLETIVGLAPDLVLGTADGNRPEDVRKLADLGLAAYVVDTRSIAEIERAIREVGALTGAEDRARTLAEALSARRERVHAAVAKLPPVSVFVALDRNPLISAGEGTFVGELVRLAGGRNVVGSALIKYPVFNMEQLLAADPEVILDAAEPRPMDSAEIARLWRALPGAAALRAVRTGRIHEVGEGSFFRPGPRIVETLERMAEMLHPGALGS